MGQVTADAADAASVVDVPGECRFEILVDGAVAGYAEYRDSGERRTFIHTVIDDAYEGQGLASRLVRSALEEAKQHGRRVIPRCEFVRGYIERHPDDYLHLVPDDVREHVGLGGA